MSKTDDIRPSGTVQVKCSRAGCLWEVFVGALDPRLPDGPFFCGEHSDAPPSLMKVADR